MAEKKCKDKKEIERLKRDYEPLKKRYGLPEFDELNEEFEIERIGEHETTYLLKMIRRAIIDKFYNFSNWFDGLISTQRISTMVILKGITQKEKDDIYRFIENISKLAIQNLALEADYSEQKEAEMIKLLYKEWKKSKQEIVDITGRINQKLQKDSAKPKYSG